VQVDYETTDSANGSTEDDFSDDCTFVAELGWEGRQIEGKEGGKV